MTRIARLQKHCYLNFVQTGGFISLFKVNHVDNNLKEIMVYVYFGRIVNNRSKKK